MDSTGDGAINRQDIEQACRKMGVIISSRAIDTIFRVTDADKNGTISREEFANFVLAVVFAAAPLVELTPAVKWGGSEAAVLKWVSHGRYGH